MTNAETIIRQKRSISPVKMSNKIKNCNENGFIKSSNSLSVPIKMCLSMLLGLTFGFLMNKSGVYVSPIIRDQMLFKRLTMLKMFFGCIGMSMLSVFLIVFRNESIYLKALNGFIQRNKRINGIQLMIGGSLIGIGMVVGGSCPGTIFVQIGSGLRNSVVTGVGACCGVLFYYIFLQKLLTKCELSKSSIVLEELPNLVGLKRIYLNLILGLIFVILSLSLEYLYPYKDDLILSDVKVLDGWSPTLCGFVVGSLQLFFIIFFEKSLGVSGGFTVLVGQLCRIKFVKELIPSLESFCSGINNSLTLLFTIGIVFGSFVSSYSSNEFPLNDKYGANVCSSFIGGFFLLIGARCAGGCTSGQGISGVSHLLIGSFIATASMFGGGILFATSYGLITQDWKFESL